MRHLDYLLEEWDLDREVESVRLCVERIREGIDRYYIYLEAAAGESELAPGEVYESMFVPGWLGCRWGLRRQLGVLFRGPLTDGRARPLIWFLRGRSRVVERLLRRHERARGLGQTEMAAALRAELTELDERLVSVIRLKVLDRIFYDFHVR